MTDNSLQENAPFPFSVIEGMMPAYPLIAVMGWAIVLASLLIGVWALSPSQSTFFSESKAIREAAGVGSDLVAANVSAHVLETWVPQFKFFGLGLGLLAITMALGTIAKSLRRMGMTIASHIRQDLRPQIPPVPRTVRIFQLSAVMGVMVLAAALVVGLLLANGVVPDYWNHSIAGQLNSALPGSGLLDQLSIISSFGFWLNPLRMVGMALLFTGITLALSVIIGTLRTQANLLITFYERASQAG